MDFEYLKEILTTLVAILCSAGGLFWTINKISIAYINRNKEKKLTFKNKNLEIVSQGNLTPDETILIKEFFTNEPVKRPALAKRLSESKKS